jgi:predicted ArsR family transcriptional regulator
MAESKKNRDGSYVLIENHCSIRSAAEACVGLCERELDLFRSILGTGVEVEREEHIVSGDRRCVYRIRSESHAGER